MEAGGAKADISKLTEAPTPRNLTMGKVRSVNTMEIGEWMGKVECTGRCGRSIESKSREDPA